MQVSIPPEKPDRRFCKHVRKNADLLAALVNDIIAECVLLQRKSYGSASVSYRLCNKLEYIVRNNRGNRSELLEPVFSYRHHDFRLGTLVPAAEWQPCENLPGIFRWDLSYYDLCGFLCSGVNET